MFFEKYTLDVSNFDKKNLILVLKDFKLLKKGNLKFIITSLSKVFSLPVYELFNFTEAVPIKTTFI
jgi:hypothetical protein